MKISNNLTTTTSSTNYESDVESDIESDFDSEIEERVNDDLEEELSINKEESTINKCCNVDCESCEFRTIKKKDPCNNPNILIENIHNVMYHNKEDIWDKEKTEMYNNLIPEPEPYLYNRFKENSQLYNNLIPEPESFDYNMNKAQPELYKNLIPEPKCIEYMKQPYCKDIEVN